MNAAENAFAIDPAHPNGLRWQRAVDAADLRGEFVADLLAAEISLRGAALLDLGCGVGGTTRALRRRGAEAFSADVDARRLRALVNSHPASLPVRLEGALLPYRSASFDGAVLQDVVEHVPEPDALLREIRRVLKPRGLLYLSTPNRFSPLNVAADPHWGLPFVALMRRRGVRFVLHSLLGRDPERKDFAELFSLAELRTSLSAAGFEMHLRQSAAARELFERPERLVWSGLHRALVSTARALRIRGIAERCANDAPGFFNRWIAPAWYVLCRAA